MPSTPRTSTSDTERPQGQRRLGNRPVFFFMAVIVATVFTVGWGIALMNYSGTFGQVSYQTLTWQVDSAEQAAISFEVNTAKPALCLITATDSRHVRVGQKEVSVNPGLHTVRAEIETIRQAATVEVVSCREQGRDSEAAD
ncbi:DUF4307 domain-containing protein [Salinactinospora qingdaonensis]|uniref:DUF4307 domain-containing protein n=1 Tax=Salinactinospora qingdaonensis TaxID=702744 RepID=A0ABP7FNC9_9ACTN